MNFFERITEHERDMSAGQRRIASYLMNRGHNGAFLTAAEISAGVGVSESSVVRFARKLGFKGFPEMQHALRVGLLKTLSPTERLDFQNENDDDAELVNTAIEVESLNLKAALEQLDPARLRIAAERICAARRRFVVGIKSSRAPAILLGHYLMKINPDVTTVSSSDFMAEELSGMTGKDTLIAFSFARYSTATIDAIQMARAVGAYTVTITDSTSAPAAQLCDDALIAPAAPTFFGNSFVASVAIVNLLLSMCTRNQPEAVRRNLERVESVASQNNRFVSSGSRDSHD